MDAFEVMGKVPRKGGCRWVGAGRGEGGGSGFRAAQAWGLRACRGVRGGSRACRGREPPERLLRDTAASEHG